MLSCHLTIDEMVLRIIPLLLDRSEEINQAATGFSESTWNVCEDHRHSPILRPCRRAAKAERAGAPSLLAPDTGGATAKENLHPEIQIFKRKLALRTKVTKASGS